MQEGCCYALANSSCILYLVFSQWSEREGKTSPGRKYQANISQRLCFLLLHGRTMCVKDTTLPHGFFYWSGPNKQIWCSQGNWIVHIALPGEKRIIIWLKKYLTAIICYGSLWRIKAGFCTCLQNILYLLWKSTLNTEFLFDVSTSFALIKILFDTTGSAELFCSVEKKFFFCHYTLNWPSKGMKNPFLYLITNFWLMFCSFLCFHSPFYLWFRAQGVTSGWGMVG